MWPFKKTTGLKQAAKCCQLAAMALRAEEYQDHPHHPPQFPTALHSQRPWRLMKDRNRTLVGEGKRNLVGHGNTGKRISKPDGILRGYVYERRHLIPCPTVE